MKELESQEDISKLEDINISDRSENTRIHFYEKTTFGFKGYIFKNVIFKSTFYDSSSIKFNNCVFIDCKIRQFDSIDIRNCLFDGENEFENIENVSIDKACFYFTEKYEGKLKFFASADISMSSCYMFGNGCYSMISANSCKYIRIEDCEIMDCNIFINCVQSSFEINECVIKELNYIFYLKNSEGFFKNIKVINLMKDIKHDSCSKSNLEWENCPMMTINKI